MNFILLCFYIIVIFASFIDTLHILLQLEGNAKVKKQTAEKQMKIWIQIQHGRNW